MEEKVMETKKCSKCAKAFNITDVEKGFYDKVSPVFA